MSSFVRTAPSMPIAAEAAPGERARRILAIVGASSGNLVEWYDFYTYSFTALYFAAAFFPSGDRTTQLLSTAGVFAAGFFMRPRTVFSLTGNSAATSFTGAASSTTRRTMRSRLYGVVRAFWWMFIRGSARISGGRQPPISQANSG
jgi:hypothetical protein